MLLCSHIAQFCDCLLLFLLLQNHQVQGGLWCEDEVRRSCALSEKQVEKLQSQLKKESERCDLRLSQMQSSHETELDLASKRQRKRLNDIESDFTGNVVEQRKLTVEEQARREELQVAMEAAERNIKNLKIELETLKGEKTLVVEKLKSECDAAVLAERSRLVEMKLMLTNSYNFAMQFGVLVVIIGIPIVIGLPLAMACSPKTRPFLCVFTAETIAKVIQPRMPSLARFLTKYMEMLLQEDLTDRFEAQWSRTGKEKETITRNIELVKKSNGMFEITQEVTSDLALQVVRVIETCCGYDTSIFPRSVSERVKMLKLDGSWFSSWIRDCAQVGSKSFKDVALNPESRMFVRLAVDCTTDMHTEKRKLHKDRHFCSVQLTVDVSCMIADNDLALKEAKQQVKDQADSQMERRRALSSPASFAPQLEDSLR